MFELIRQFTEIAFFKAKPQDLPASNPTLPIAVVVALLTYIIASSSESDLFLSIKRAILDLLVTAVFLYGGLLLQKRPTRFYQSFSALAGAGAVINVMAIPFMFGVGSGEQVSALAGFILFLLFGWSLALSAHIFRHTFELSMPGSALAAIIYVMTAIQISQLFFQPAAA